MKNNLLVHALALATTFVLLITVGCDSFPKSPTTQPQAGGFELTVEDLDGNPVRASDYRGKVLVVNFWAIWCPPCRAEMPDLDAVYRQYRNQGVVILAVNVAESSADIQAFAERLGLTLPIVRDSQRQGTRIYKVEALPTTFFIDREGQIRRRQLGMMNKNFMVQQIESLLD